MTDLATIDIVGAWVGIFLTMAVLSFLYGDNPFYKLAEHLFIGVSIGYIVVVQFRNNFWTKLERGLTWWDVVPVALIAAMFVKFASKQLAWLGRFPLAFVVALYAGQSITGLVGSDLGDQMTVASRPLVVYKVDVNHAPPGELATIPGVSAKIADKLAAERELHPFDSVDDMVSRPSLTAAEREELADARGGMVGLDARAGAGDHEIDWFGVASQILLLVALLTGLLYFYFSIAHRGAIGRVSRVGVWILMIGFGASFGWTVQGRIALAIARAQDVRGKLVSPHEAAQIHGEAAALVSMVVIALGIYVWERRRRGGAKPPREAS